MSVLVENKEKIRYGLTVAMETIICYKCAVPFAVPQQLREHLKSSQDTFYCPNGHQQAYCKSTESELREKLEQERKDKEWQVSNLLNENASLRFNYNVTIVEKKKAERKLKRIEKRISGGVCPCCDRTFENLAAHMKSQHPKFKEAE